ncbi:glycosyltransferase family 4 protein [Bacillus sp. RO3]|nr:glycosyltransferase family 4 protein [Bacillus sp. RO3]
MKVLLHGSVPPPTTGVGIANEMVIKELENNNNDVTVILRGGRNKKNKALSWDGRISFLRIILAFIEVTKIVLFITFKKFDVFYLCIGQSKLGIFTDIIKILASVVRRVPVVIHVHGGRLHESIDSFYGKEKKYLLQILNRCKSIIALTEFQADKLTQLGLNNVVVVNNGVNSSEVCSDEVAFNKISRNNSGLNVLYLSNLIEEKGYRDLVEAGLELKDSNIKFKFAGQWGSPNDKTWFNNNTQSAKNIEYVGVVRGGSKLDLLEWADIWVLPTYFVEEGLPISLLEAMWSGCAIITTKHRGIPEVISEDGAIFVNKKDSEGIIDAINTLNKNRDLLSQLKKANALSARRRFSEKVFSRKIVEILKA